jgi:hypothetical protein
MVGSHTPTTAFSTSYIVGIAYFTLPTMRREIEQDGMCFILPRLSRDHADLEGTHQLASPVQQDTPLPTGVLLSAFCHTV